MSTASAPVQRTLTTLLAAFGVEPFRYQDAVALGVTPEQLRSALAADGLSRLHRGWYFVARHEPPLPRAALATARRLAERGIPSVIAGSGPASLWGIHTLGSTQPPLLLVDPGYDVRPGMRGGGQQPHPQRATPPQENIGGV